MELVIRKAGQLCINEIAEIDGRFVIDSQLLLQAKDNQIHTTVTDLPAREKRYADEGTDHPAYVSDPDKVIFLAYVDGHIAGRIILRKNWNKYAYIDDVAVDVKFRQMGVGRALIGRAKQWAQEKELPGIMLETQSNNVRACLFYESCGFKIGGFDNFLYRGLDNDTDEVAVYYYLLLEE